ncbi:MAG TPA: glycosyltransferase family 4 protein [Ktedonobacterales bacterium]|nr:glycosyltransferase family 4 protein [Ktedonobacterales bacterium]
MRIAQIAPLQLAVPPRTYGGTERCISNITEALVALGHDVTLFATADSSTGARLVPMRDEAIRFNSKIDATALHLAMLSRIYQQADQFDAIHSHLDYLTLPFAAKASTPTVLTLHGRLDAPETVKVFREFKGCNYVAISDSQRSQIPDLNWAATIHHAIDPGQFPYRDAPGSYLAFVGRITRDKGIDRAIRIAQKTGIPLKIAAKVDPAERKFFEEVIKPTFDDPLIEFLGPLNEKKKNTLMSEALALLMPIDWPEPFGMVFIESLACGTPVLTRPCGSVPELLEDGVTGFIRESDDELAEAVTRVAQISRAGCREYVQRRFGIRDMALKYLDVYTQVQQRGRLFAVPTVKGTPVEPVRKPSQAQTNENQSTLIS